MSLEYHLSPIIEQLRDEAKGYRELAERQGTDGYTIEAAQSLEVAEAFDKAAEALESVVA